MLQKNIWGERQRKTKRENTVQSYIKSWFKKKKSLDERNRNQSRDSWRTVSHIEETTSDDDDENYMFLFFPLHFSLFCMSESIVNSFCFAEHHHHHHHHDRHRYSVILSEQWVEVFSDIFAEDNYTPIFCDKPEDYTLITTQFPYKDNVLEMVRTMSH